MSSKEYNQKKKTRPTIPSLFDYNMPSGNGYLESAKNRSARLGFSSTKSSTNFFHRFEALSTNVESVTSTHPIIDFKDKRINDDQHRRFQTEGTQDNPASSTKNVFERNLYNNSVRSHMDTNTNFLFLKQVKTREKKIPQKEDAKDYTALFELENIDIGSQMSSKRSQNRWKKLEESKPIHSYTIYDGLRRSISGDIGMNPLYLNQQSAGSNTAFLERIDEISKGMSKKKYSTTKKTMEIASRENLKPLKRKILKILQNENLKLEKPKHRSFFGKYTVKRFLNSQAEVKHSLAAKKIVEDEILNPKIRERIRNYLSEKQSITPFITATNGFNRDPNDKIMIVSMTDRRQNNEAIDQNRPTSLTGFHKHARSQDFFFKNP